MSGAEPDMREEIERWAKGVLDGTTCGMVVVFNESGWIEHASNLSGAAARYMADHWRDSIYRETEPMPPV